MKYSDEGVGDMSPKAMKIKNQFGPAIVAACKYCASRAAYPMTFPHSKEIQCMICERCYESGAHKAQGAR